jgi:hypothetical protein
MTKRTLEPVAPEEQPQERVEVSIPILSTEVKIGVFHTPEGDYAMLSFHTVLGSGTYALDRSQTLTLGAELMKLARSMPSQKELEKVQKKLILPS